VLGAKQGSEPFWEWTLQVQQVNALLTGTSLEVTDNKLREQLEAQMDENLCEACDKTKTNDEDDLNKWLEAVKIIDGHHHEDHLKAHANTEDVACALYSKRIHSTSGLGEPSCKMNTQSCPTSLNTENTNENKNPTPFTSKTIAHPCVLKLTDVEHTLLNNNDGCTKCRTFFTGHRAFDCPNDWPSTTNYKTLTQAEVDAAKHKCNKVAAVAATVPTETVASVMPKANAMEEEDSMESDKVSTQLPPIFSVPTSRHLVWHCAADSHLSNFLTPVDITTLIDDGAHIVMIHPHVANRLGLKRRKITNYLCFTPLQYMKRMAPL
jgi:hypothetical protein